MERLYVPAHYIVLKNYFDNLEEIFGGSVPPLLYPEINKKRFVKNKKESDL